MRFTFIDAAKAEFPIQRLCQVLEVSQSGYFAWRESQPASVSATIGCCSPMSDPPRRATSRESDHVVACSPGNTRSSRVASLMATYLEADASGTQALYLRTKAQQEEAFLLPGAGNVPGACGSSD